MGLENPSQARDIFLSPPLFFLFLFLLFFSLLSPISLPDSYLSFLLSSSNLPVPATQLDSVDPPTNPSHQQLRPSPGSMPIAARQLNPFRANRSSCRCTSSRRLAWSHPKLASTLWNTHKLEPSLIGTRENEDNSRNPSSTWLSSCMATAPQPIRPSPELPPLSSSRAKPSSWPPLGASNRISQSLHELVKNPLRLRPFSSLSGGTASKLLTQAMRENLRKSIPTTVAPGMYCRRF